MKVGSSFELGQSTFWKAPTSASQVTPVETLGISVDMELRHIVLHHLDVIRCLLHGSGMRLMQDRCTETAGQVSAASTLLV